MSEALETGAVTPEETTTLADVVEQQTQQTEAPEGEQPEGEQEKKESKTYSQEEVDRIVQKAKKNARYLTRKETEAELYRQMSERQTAPPLQQQQVDGPPKREDFDDYEAFIRAEARYEAKAAFREEQERFTQQTKRQTEEQRNAQLYNRFQSDVSKARESIPDFDAVLESADVPVTPAMRAAIVESEVGALLTYHLAKHPQEAERIAGLSPTAAMKAIGALEASLSAQKAPAVSKAPAPIKPIGSRSGGQVDPSKLSMDDYMAWRKKQDFGR